MIIRTLGKLGILIEHLLLIQGKYGWLRSSTLSSEKLI